MTSACLATIPGLCLDSQGHPLTLQKRNRRGTAIQQANCAAERGLSGLQQTNPNRGGICMTLPSRCWLQLNKHYRGPWGRFVTIYPIQNLGDTMANSCAAPRSVPQFELSLADVLNVNSISAVGTRVLCFVLCICIKWQEKCKCCKAQVCMGKKVRTPEAKKNGVSFTYDLYIGNLHGQSPSPQSAASAHVQTITCSDYAAI